MTSSPKVCFPQDIELQWNKMYSIFPSSSTPPSARQSTNLNYLKRYGHQSKFGITSYSTRTVSCTIVESKKVY